jgi:hypothetical protein
MRHLSRGAPNSLSITPLSLLSSVSFIDSIPADKHSLHDIRFRFKVDNILTVIATNRPDLE